MYVLLQLWHGIMYKHSPVWPTVRLSLGWTRRFLSVLYGFHGCAYPVLSEDPFGSLRQYSHIRNDYWSTIRNRLFGQVCSSRLSCWLSVLYSAGHVSPFQRSNWDSHSSAKLFWYVALLLFVVFPWILVCSSCPLCPLMSSANLSCGW